MSFDFGSSNSNSNDPTSDFVSKFPDLDGDGGDAALAAAATGTAGGMSGGGAPGGWGEDDDLDLLGGGGGAGAASSGSAAVGSEKPRDEREAFESSFPELDDPDLNGGGSSAPIDAQPTVSKPLEE
jgi:hypothetical protein